MDTMLSRALREFTAGPLNQLVVNLSGQDGGRWENEFKRFLRKEPCWANTEILPTQAEDHCTELLVPVCEFPIPDVPNSFAVDTKFLLNTKVDHAVKIVDISYRFADWFFDKVEQPITERDLYCLSLSRPSLDASIISALCDGERFECLVADVFAVMKACVSDASFRCRFYNGHANIFYVRDKSNILRSVDICWAGDGWQVDAHHLMDPLKWNDGSIVLSRCPVSDIRSA